MYIVKLRLSWCFLLYISLIPVLISCSNNDNALESASSKIELDNQRDTKTPDAVKVMVVKLDDFLEQSIINGKLSPVQSANLKFSEEGLIESIFVEDGQSVRKGDRIAKLVGTQEASNYSFAQLEYQKAIIEFEDHILRMGHKLSDSSTLSAETIRIAKLRSGLSLASLNLAKCENGLKNLILIAPFDGVIANLKGKPYNYTNSSEFICTLIDNSSFDVMFSAVEAELDMIGKTKSVSVVPLMDSSRAAVPGKIVSINPSIDESGMFLVKARVHNNKNMVSGMKVKVSLLKNTGKKIIIPKTAVLERQGRNIVFTVGVNNNANWNYVELDEENEFSYSVKSGLKLGDKLIVNGSFNLSEGSRVVASD